jgi:site-specific recombinase XerC
MPPVTSPAYRHRFLAVADGRHDAWLAASALAPRTRRTYGQQVRWYLAWLDSQPRAAASLSGPAARRWFTAGNGVVIARALSDEESAARQRAADEAADLYHRHLLGSGAAPASVKLAMSAVGSLHAALGLRAPVIPDRVTTRPYARPRTLTAAERAWVLGAAQRRGTRDHAIAALAADAGLRPGEIVAVDLPDVSADADAVRVRGGAYPHRNRVVPVTTADARAALAAWCRERAGIRAVDPALFLTCRRTRIALRTVEHVIRDTGAAAGVRVSPSAIRNTRAAQMADDGMSPHLMASRLGHARAETLRPFTSTVPACGVQAGGGGGGEPAGVAGGSEQRGLPGRGGT